MPLCTKANTKPKCKGAFYLWIKRSSARARAACVYEDMTSTVSGTECTGLMPTPPQDEDEYEAYQELHGMEVPKE